MSQAKSPRLQAVASWRLASTPEAYDAFCQRFGLYRSLAEYLVASAFPSGASMVLDVGCGTGVVSSAVLAACGKGHVVGLDRSHAMLLTARRNIPGPRIAWVEGTLESVVSPVKPWADGIVCSAAAWQIGIRSLIASSGRILVEDGVLAFNIPLRLVQRDSARGPTTNAIVAHCQRAGLHVTNMAVQRVPQSAAEIAAWFEIPVFSRRSPAHQSRQELDERCSSGALSEWVVITAVKQREEQ